MNWNTVSFAQRLCRYLTIKDITLVPMDDAMGICDAMNAGVQEYYTEVPSAYKGTTFSGLFLPGASVTPTFTNGSNIFSGWSASAAQTFSTLVVQGDTRQNIIVGPNQLRDIYTGPSGPQPATVYGDCIQIQQITERFTADPCLVDINRILIRDENWRCIGQRGWGFGAMEFFPLGTAMNRRIGTPIRYWIEREGESQGVMPPFVLRVDSLPDIEYRVEIEGLLAPTQVGLPDLTVPQPLSLDSQIIELMVLPMAVYHLTEHPLWADKDNFKRVASKYELACKKARARVPDVGSSENYVRTPRGY